MRRLHVLQLVTAALLAACCGCKATEPGHDTGLDVVADAGDAVLDSTVDAAGDTALDVAADVVPDIATPPTYWTAAATEAIGDLNFVMVDDKPFFAIGFDTHSGLVYDGVTGPNECDPATGHGYAAADLNVQKNRLASQAGANFAYLWGYGDQADEIVDVDPPFKGIFHGGYGTSPAPDQDIIPIIFNAFGEEDMDDRSESNALRMRAEFESFRDRVGNYSPEARPHLPPFADIPWFSWHPTSRMRGGGNSTSENLTTERATLFAQATNMMIGDFYTYTQNRFDRTTEQGALDAIIYRQIGELDEDYDYWLSIDDPDHRDFFSSGWDLAYSLVTKRNPDAVVWMWLQGYSFTFGINHALCERGRSDAGKKGDFPPDRYIRKDITSVIAAGATGIIFFGFFMNLMPETEVLLKHFSALAYPEVYDGALTTPRLKLAADTTYLGEAGHDGNGRVHALVKWHEDGKKAYVIASNPGPQPTTITLTFPWSLDGAEIYDWYTPEFVEDTGLVISDRTLTYTIPMDDGVIIRVRPLMP